MAGLSEEQLKIIENNIDDFLAGRITIAEIAKMADTRRQTTSKKIRVMLENDPEKLETFEKLTNSATSQRARYLILYTNSIRENFSRILSREITKKELAKIIGIDQMVLGSLIMEIYADEPDKIAEYEAIKNVNSKNGRTYTRTHREKNEKREDLKKDKTRLSRIDFIRFSRDKKIKWIIYRINRRQVDKKGANIRTEEFIEQRIEKQIEYFLGKRNNLIDEQRINFTENDIFTMLFENPNLLSPAEDKKDKVFEYLDGYNGIGIENANHIAMRYPGILTSSLDKTIRQVRMAEEIGILDKLIKSPKGFIPSLETMYALAMFARERCMTEEQFQNMSVSSIYIGRKPLLEKYHVTYEELYEKYRLPEQYRNIQEESSRDSFIKRISVEGTPGTSEEKRDGDVIVKKDDVERS